jgi:hypothetical protein
MAFVIAVDCDEVLCEFVDGINRWHNRVHGTAIPLSAYTSTHFAKVPGWGSDAVADDKVQAFFSGSSEWRTLAPLPGALAALRALKAAYPALDLQVVTARSHRQRADTLAWLEQHYAGIFSQVHFLSAYDNALRVDAPARSKGEVCRELGALALIDDSPSYCISASPHLPLVLLFSRVPWNAGRAKWEHPALPGNVVRTPDWGVAGALLHRLCAAGTAAGAAGPAAPPPRPMPLAHAAHATGGALEASAPRACAAALRSLVAQCLLGGAGGGAAAAGGAAALAPAGPGQGEDLLLALALCEGAARFRTPQDASERAQWEEDVQGAVAAGLVRCGAEEGGVRALVLVR